MTQIPAPLQTQEEMEAFTVLVLRYLDGTCSAEEVQKVKEAIVESAGYRELFVHICRIQGNLHEVHAPRRAEFQQKAATAPPTAPAADSSASHDPGADTVIQELSAEDTAHPELKGVTLKGGASAPKATQS